MKLLSIFILAACLTASATGLSQKVTLNLKNVPIQKVFTEVFRQTGVSILYNEALFKDAPPVTIKVKDAQVTDVLQQCLKNLPLEFSIENNAIVVKAKPTLSGAEGPVIASDEGAKQPAFTDITGRITNAQGEPLSGASIIIKRTGKGTIADANGKFSIKNVNADDIIEISFTGYKTQSIKVGDRTNLLLVLEVAVDELDRVQIQAYGKTSKRLSTGNIATVTAEEIERQPVMNPLLALQGKVAGLDVQQINGYASATIKVELRGRPNINNNFTSDPLYIVDGVPLTILDISGNSSNLYQSGSTGFLQSGIIGPAGGQSPFFNLNPNDIESIEVLKDADATAIYGSRGANGVILITTKRGKAGKTNFSLNIQEGVNKVTRFYDLMTTQQYLEMRKEALRNDGITPSLQNGDYDLLQWDTMRYTNWQKALYGGVGKNTNFQGSLAGGNAQTNFRIGAGYNRSTDIMTVDGANEQATLSFNLSHASLYQKFKISLSGGYSYTLADMVGFSAEALIIPPNAPEVFDSAGNLNYNAWGDYGTSARNAFQFSSLKQTYTSKTTFLNSNLNLSYQPIKGLIVGTTLGYNNGQANQINLIPISSQDPLSNPTGSAAYGYNLNKNWIIEPQIVYGIMTTAGRFDIQLGGTLQETTTDGTSISARGYTNDLFLKNLANAPTKDIRNFRGNYKYAAVFGRLTYNLKNRYIVNLTARRDGSSRFGNGKQFGNFGSVGIAWIFTEELFTKKILKFLSFGKVRTNYGLTGNDGVGEYAYLTRWSSNGTQPYNGSSSLVPIQHANPNFHWQTNKKLEAAIDLGFLDEKIIFSSAYYRNRCGDQLVPFPLPNNTGFSSVVANSPALVQNSGVEFSLMVNLISKKEYNLSFNFNTGFNQNKLVAYPNLDQSPYASSLVVGKSLNIVQLLHYVGVDPMTGQYAFEDKNHDGQISFNQGTNSNDTYIKNLSPKFIGGFGVNAECKGLALSLFFNIKKQVGRNIFNNLSGYTFGSISNQPAVLIGKQWQKPGDVATVSKFTTQFIGSNLQYNYLSDGAYTDASFIRLSNLSLSYNLPDGVSKKMGMKGCSFYLHANNLFTITNYTGSDPETQNFGGLPPVKTIVGGIKFNF